MIGYVTNAYDREVKWCDEATFWSLVRMPHVQHTIDKVRQGHTELKQQLPALVPMGIGRENSVPRKVEHLMPTGLVAFDWDHCTVPPRDVLALLWQRMADKGVDVPRAIALAHVTPSGNGLRVVMHGRPGSSIEQDMEYVATLMPEHRLDPVVKDLTRLSFCPREGDILYINSQLLFGPRLEVYDNVNENSRWLYEDEDENKNCHVKTTHNSEFIIQNYDTFISALERQLGLEGTVTEGTRNQSLFTLTCYARQVLGDDVDTLYANLPTYGLSEQECRRTIRSAVSRARAEGYSPVVERALEELQSGSYAQQTYQETIISPEFEDIEVPSLVQLFTPLVPDNAREAAAAMIFSPLGSYLNNTVAIRDVSGKRRNLQFTTIIVGNSSSGKGFADMVSDLITERHRQHDKASWTQITAWQEQKRTTPKGEPAPIKPQVPIYLLPPNMTEPALLERFAALEPVNGRAYLKVSEIDELRKMQTAAGTRLGAGQEIVLSAFDTAPYGALRVSADAVSAMTVTSINIVASSTYPGTQDFFRQGIERGSVGRCDIAIVPDSYDVPRYHDPTPEFYTQLDIIIDRLQQATGEIVNDDIDRTIEDIRLAYSNPQSVLSYHHNPEHYKLCHRQLLITKQKATILYICNNYQWDPTWEPWLHHVFYYGMQCKLEVFAGEIASWEKRQIAATAPRIAQRSGPQSELENLPQTFTLNDIVVMKRHTASPTDTDEQLTTKAKTLIRTWRLRGRIVPTEQEGVWEKA